MTSAELRLAFFCRFGLLWIPEKPQCFYLSVLSLYVHILPTILSVFGFLGGICLACVEFVRTLSA